MKTKTIVALAAGLVILYLIFRPKAISAATLAANTTSPIGTTGAAGALGALGISGIAGGIGGAVAGIFSGLTSGIKSVLGPGLTANPLGAVGVSSQTLALEEANDPFGGAFLNPDPASLGEGDLFGGAFLTPDPASLGEGDIFGGAFLNPTADSLGTALPGLDASLGND